MQRVYGNLIGRTARRVSNLVSLWWHVRRDEHLAEPAVRQQAQSHKGAGPASAVARAAQDDTHFSSLSLPLTSSTNNGTLTT